MFNVYTVTEVEGKVSSDKVCSADTKAKAMDQAKKLAGGKKAEFVGNYGPTSCAYVGEEVTAVVSW